MNREELLEEMFKQANEMSMSERIKRYKKGEEVDFLPYDLSGLDYALLDMHGYTTSQMQNDFDIFSRITEIRIKEYGIEGINVRLGLRKMGAAMGSKIYFPKHGIDYIERFALEDLSDLENIKIPDPYNNEILTPLLKHALKVKERFPDQTVSTGVAGAFTVAASLRPLEKILRDTIKNKDKLKKLLEICIEGSLKWVEVFVKELGSCNVTLGDPVSCSNILSPKQFKELSLPYLKILVDEIKNISGHKPPLHICGNTKPIWAELSNLNIASFSVDNCEDIFETKKTFGGKMAIVGNVPPVDIMKLGTINDVINSVRKCISKAGDSPNGYIVATGCAVPFKTPRENIQAFIYTVRRYGARAKIGRMPIGMAE